MRRREFILAAGGGAASPRLARAQQTAVPRVGVLVPGTPAPDAFLLALRDGLRSFDDDGRNIHLEIRSAEVKFDPASILPA